LVIQTPHGLRNIEIGKTKDLPEINKGDFVVAVGSRNDFDFNVDQIKVVDNKKMGAINRGIDFKFEKRLDDKNIKDLPPNDMFFKKEDKECIGNCFKEKISPRECFKECHK